jgi:hypothetical protein
MTTTPLTHRWERSMDTTGFALAADAVLTVTSHRRSFKPEIQRTLGCAQDKALRSTESWSSNGHSPGGNAD